MLFVPTDLIQTEEETMNNHKSISLADIVFEKLENDILSGKYPYGEILTEGRLSEELGVSRTPIREALRRLEAEHLIAETNKGVTVLGITKKDISDIFDIRLRLEGMAARLAAENADEAARENLVRIVDLQEFYTEKQDAEHIKDMDNDFHYNLYKSSNSPVLLNTLLPLHKKAQKYRKTSVSDGSRAHQSADEHRAILDAILARDGDLAEKTTVEHILNAKESILNRRKQNWD